MSSKNKSLLEWKQDFTNRTGELATIANVRKIMASSLLKDLASSNVRTTNWSL